MTDSYIPISSWADDDKPREKLLSKGVATLSTNELFAILLRSGSGGESALDLSRRILMDCNNDLDVLARLSVNDFMSRYKGVGVAKAAAIISAIEIGRRRSLSVAVKEPILSTSRDLYDFLRPKIGDLNHEEFWVIAMSNACRIKSSERLFTGGIESTMVDMRLVFQKVLESKASTMVIAHNHPSGNRKPSGKDNALTSRIREAAKMLDITLLDHIIVCSDDYYSYADEGTL